MTPETEPPEERVDRSLDCLGHARRRRLLAVVAAVSTPVDVDTVVEGFTAPDVGGVAGSAAADRHDEIANSPVHSHMPKLVAAGVVDADSGGTPIAEGHRFDPAIGYLDSGY